MSSVPTYVGDGARNIFVASTQAGIATSTGLSTTQTGFTLSNPFGSGKTLVLLQFNGAVTTATAGAAGLVLAANVNPVATAVTQTTALTVRAANLGVSKSAVGLAASGVTLPAAPVVVRAWQLAVAGSSITPAAIQDKIDGALTVAPGCAVSISSITTAVTGIWSLVWEEIDEIN
jgi:uncharacterized membrane protein (DUF4010 family)